LVPTGGSPAIGGLNLRKITDLEPLGACRFGFSPYLLASKTQPRIVRRGHPDLGRPTVDCPPISRVPVLRHLE
jgi:hypothetical protein